MLGRTFPQETGVKQSRISVPGFEDGTLCGKECRPIMTQSYQPVRKWRPQSHNDKILNLSTETMKTLNLEK